MRIDQDNGVIEVGNVIFSIALQGARMSTEAHQLLASYVFDELQYRRYEWKCDALNAPSILEKQSFTKIVQEIRAGFPCCKKNGH